MRQPQRDRRPSASHLSPTIYNDDGASLRSVSDQDSDSEDDQVIYGAQTSLEIAEHDHTVLEEEEEREKLLAGGGAGDGLRRMFSLSNGSKVVVGKRERRKQKRKERKERQRNKKNRLLNGGEEEGELMFEMEEGGLRSDTSADSSEGSSGVDKLKHRNVFERKSRWSRWCKFGLIYMIATVLFLGILFGAYKISQERGRQRHGTVKMLSNGTSIFGPTTILISLDGFRADFLDRGITPTLSSFIAQGISPRYMTPSFPSVTFPNHYTLVTGLYPESHGIVGNTFWDPDWQEEFYYTNRSMSMRPKWWGGEPIWVSAEYAGVKTAIHMWPGSEAHIGGIEPAFLDKYNGKEALSKKVDRILGLLDLPGPELANVFGDQRPQLIAAYVPVVDSDGHKYGPNSTAIRTTINNVDTMLHDLFAGLETRNLTNVVNVVVVSDHGMATTSTERLIQLDDLVDPNDFDHTDGWPLYGLRPKDPSKLRSIYDSLKKPGPNSDNFDVYLRDFNMPERYHFSKNNRIAPLWIIPKTGWAIVTKAEFNVEEARKTGKVYHPMGLHGYDHEHPLMRAIFVARGPAFPHEPNSRMHNFQNTEVYNIVCDSLGITPKPNNGTLRLPLQPAGLHSDPEAAPLETPPDPPVPTSRKAESAATATASSLSQPAKSTHSVENLAPSQTPESDPASVPIGVDNPDDVPRPVVGDENQQSKETSPKGKLEDIWNYIKGNIDSLKGWISGASKDKASDADKD